MQDRRASALFWCLNLHRLVRRLIAPFFVLVGFSAIPILSAQSGIGAWQRWEKKLTGSANYSANGGNPYRDLTIAVTFSCPGSPSFGGYAFWDGEESVGGVLKSIFRIRATFPDTCTQWTWASTCAGSTGGVTCGSDPALSTTGQVSVNSVSPCAGGTASCLRASGLPKTVNNSYLALNNDRRFFWLGDTAWTAAAETPNGNLSTWQSYVNDRAVKGFTTVLLAPAPAWQDIAPVLPAALNYSFRQVSSGCGNSNLPNACSAWVPSYWQKVDQMVEYANAMDLMVVMVGMMDPVTLIPAQFPATSEAKIFARNFAARLEAIPEPA